MVNTRAASIALWIVGAVVIAAGVFLDWMEISVTFADGSGQTITASGLDLYTEYRGTGMPVSASTPVLYLLFAVFVAFLALICWKRNEKSHATIGFTMIVILAAMVLTGFMAVDSMIMYADPPAGVNVSGIPEWLTDIVSGDVSSATLGDSYGYMVSVVGQLVSSAAALLYTRQCEAS